MSAAPIVLTDLRIRAIDQAPHQKIELPARACLSGRWRCAAQRPPKRSAGFNVVRGGIANRSTAQK
jgi:hypothetical protein